MAEVEEASSSLLPNRVGVELGAMDQPTNWVLACHHRIPMEEEQASSNLVPMILEEEGQCRALDSPPIEQPIVPEALFSLVLLLLLTAFLVGLWQSAQRGSGCELPLRLALVGLVEALQELAVVGVGRTVGVVDGTGAAEIEVAAEIGVAAETGVAVVVVAEISVAGTEKIGTGTGMAETGVVGQMPELGCCDENRRTQWGQLGPEERQNHWGMGMTGKRIDGVLELQRGRKQLMGRQHSRESSEGQIDVCLQLLEGGELSKQEGLTEHGEMLS